MSLACWVVTEHRRMTEDRAAPPMAHVLLLAESLGACFEVWHAGWRLKFRRLLGTGRRSC